MALCRAADTIAQAPEELSFTAAFQDNAEKIARLGCFSPLTSSRFGCRVYCMKLHCRDASEVVVAGIPEE